MYYIDFDIFWHLFDLITITMAEVSTEVDWKPKFHRSQECFGIPTAAGVCSSVDVGCCRLAVAFLQWKLQKHGQTWEVAMFLLQHFPPGQGGVGCWDNDHCDPVFPLQLKDPGFLPLASTGIRIDFLIGMYAVIWCILSVVWYTKFRGPYHIKHKNIRHLEYMRVYVSMLISLGMLCILFVDLDLWGSAKGIDLMEALTLTLQGSDDFVVEWWLTKWDQPSWRNFWVTSWCRLYQFKIVLICWCSSRYSRVVRRC